jgi:predicted DNA-binding mobile mystery protein A
MTTIRANNCRGLDRRLSGLDRQIGPRPPGGWIRTLREAIGMSTYELAQAMGVSQPRVVGIERAEPNGSVRISTLERAAEALDCTLCYVLVPREPLEYRVSSRR